MANTFPLLVHAQGQVVVWRNGCAISREHFLFDVDYVARRLPNHLHAINLCEDRYHFMVAFAAILIRGQTSLLPANHATHTVRDVTVLYPDSYCLVDHALDGFENHTHTLTLPEDDSVISSARSVALPVPQIDAGHLACIAFTSGSTGQPGANPKTWSQLVTGTRLIASHLHFGQPGPVNIVATVPPQHMYGLENSILLPLVAGDAVCSGRPFFPEDVRQGLTAVPGPRLLVTTPVHLKACVEAGLEWPEISGVISATAPLSIELAQRAEQVFGSAVLEIYGCTECGSMATRRTTDGDAWQLFDGFTIRQDDGNSVARADHLPNETGLHDVIEMLPGNRFTLHGRTADMLNVAGKRASLADLNIKLNQIEGVRDGVIFDPSDGSEGVTRLVAMVSAPGIDEKDIIDALKTKIDPAFVPRPVYRVEALPREKTGKLSRKKLLAMLDELRALR